MLRFRWHVFQLKRNLCVHRNLYWRQKKQQTTNNPKVATTRKMWCKIKFWIQIGIAWNLAWCGHWAGGPNTDTIPRLLPIQITSREFNALTNYIFYYSYISAVPHCATRKFTIHMMLFGWLLNFERGSHREKKKKKKTNSKIITAHCTSLNVNCLAGTACNNSETNTKKIMSTWKSTIVLHQETARDHFHRTHTQTMLHLLDYSITQLQIPHTHTHSITQY